MPSATAPCEKSTSFWPSLKGVQARRAGQLSRFESFEEGRRRQESNPLFEHRGAIVPVLPDLELRAVEAGEPPAVDREANDARRLFDPSRGC